NKGGERDPSVLFDSGAYDLYFAALDSGGVHSIGFSSAPTVGAGSNSPNNASWSSATKVLGTGFDGAAVSHPSVIKDGSTYVMYYTDLSATPTIGRATSATAGGAFGPDVSAVLTAG